MMLQYTYRGGYEHSRADDCPCVLTLGLWPKTASMIVWARLLWHYTQFSPAQIRLRRARRIALHLPCRSTVQRGLLQLHIQLQKPHRNSINAVLKPSNIYHDSLIGPSGMQNQKHVARLALSAAPLPYAPSGPANPCWIVVLVCVGGQLCLLGASRQSQSALSPVDVTRTLRSMGRQHKTKTNVIDQCNAHWRAMPGCCTNRQRATCADCTMQPSHPIPTAQPPTNVAC